MVSKMMPKVQGNCDVTPKARENRGRAACEDVQFGPFQLRDSHGKSEELGTWDVNICLGILTLW